MAALRALVVDDSSLNRRTIGAMLEEIDGVGDIELAADGAEALRKVEASPPDFITLDLEMPRLDGYEFLQLLMDRHPLPVVVDECHRSQRLFFSARWQGIFDVL